VEAKQQQIATIFLITITGPWLADNDGRRKSKIEWDDGCNEDG